MNKQSSSPSTTKSAVLATASIVTALSIAERALGFLYRIVLSRLIGAEGLGLYQVALSVFAVFLTFGTGGIPITVSRLITKSKAENSPLGASSATSAGLLLSLLLTLPACLILGLFGNKFTLLFSDARSLSVFKILLIGLIFSAFYAVFRGSFWGENEFLTPSVLEIAEESVMVIAGILLLQNITDPLVGAQKAAWAVVISYLFSFTASLLCFLIRGGKFSTPKKALKPLFNATMPITSVRASSSLVASAVAVLLPVMLMRSGASNEESLQLFGIISGMVMPILMIPATVLGSIALVLVPKLTEDFYRKNYTRLFINMERGLRVAFLIACLLLPFFYVLGDDLGAIAYSNLLAGEMIRKGCPLLLPMSLSMITTAMLNSMGFEKQSFVYYFVGAAAMLLCILILPAFFGAYAYLIGMFFSFLLTALCNLLLLRKKFAALFKTHNKQLLKNCSLGVLGILPVSFLGKLFSSLFKRFLGELTCVFATASLLLLFSAILWTIFGIIKQSTLRDAKEFFFKKRGKTKKAKNSPNEK